MNKFIQLQNFCLLLFSNLGERRRSASSMVSSQSEKDVEEDNSASHPGLTLATNYGGREKLPHLKGEELPHILGEEIPQLLGGKPCFWSVPAING